jgi:hypothetical protein
VGNSIFWGIRKGEWFIYEKNYRRSLHGGSGSFIYSPIAVANTLLSDKKQKLNGNSSLEGV